ncbi:hypothetical protein CDL12_13937 [Handroanthus impetiginosus]|uniref:Transmembrane protein n=1 Tax=Handroanthus impetiginosus TaxID=429701 RepID=A0A2G9H7F3_9LAMI|nr:hypothetical protein CDL12_13937 [Handroanthus impetiginosus]
MWDRDWCCCLIRKKLQKQPNQSSLLLTRVENEAVCWESISFSAIAGMLTSWLSRRRWRYLFLCLCSPFLLPLACASCPIICAVEICFLICRRRRKVSSSSDDELSRGGEGREVGLLQRYLEDQLMLVIELGGDCENVGDGGVDVEYFDSTRPLLQ